MTATEQLRKLLDERGVGTYKHEVPEAVCLAYFDGARWHDCWESTGGEVNVTFSMTPEQAVAATLGTGTCHDVYPNATYCFTCSKCGHVRRFIQGWNNVTDTSQDEFNFCPNCGRKVVGE